MRCGVVCSEGHHLAESGGLRNWSSNVDSSTRFAHVGDRANDHLPKKRLPSPFSLH